MVKNLEAANHFPVMPLYYSYYYDQMSAAQLSYRDYLFKVAMVRDIEDTNEINTDRYIAANEYFTQMLKSSIVDAQIASTRALYNNLQDINGTLITGFDGLSQQVEGLSSDMRAGLTGVSQRLEGLSNNVREGFNGLKQQLGVGFSVVSGQLQNISQQVDKGFTGLSRQLGSMEASMFMGLAHLDKTVQASSIAICKKLDVINETLNNPFLTQARELYRMALPNYNKGLYEEALEDLRKAAEFHKTDYNSWFLIGMIYLCGLNKDCDVVDLDASIEALKKAVRYIRQDAKTEEEAQKMASEICFYLGFAQQTKAMDLLHTKKKRDFKSCLENAKNSYWQSYQYSLEMMEALYNRARCNVLLGNVDEAMQDLAIIILQKRSYCIKVKTDSDFFNVKEALQELFNKIKEKVYPKVKTIFDRIGKIKAEFRGPYSSELVQLMEKYLPNDFDEDTPLVDVLEGQEFFHIILEKLEEEKAKEEARIAEEKAREEARIAEDKAKELARIAKEKKRQRKLEEEKKRQEQLEWKWERERKARNEDAKFVSIITVAMAIAIISLTLIATCLIG